MPIALPSALAVVVGSAWVAWLIAQSAPIPSEPEEHFR